MPTEKSSQMKPNSRPGMRGDYQRRRRADSPSAQYRVNNRHRFQRPN